MAQPQPTGDWHAAAADSAPDTQRLRRELQDAPRELVDWEASCLKNIADLLDSLDKARVRWESLGNDLKETRARLTRVQEERDLLAESHADADKARDHVREAREELEAVRQERDGAAAELAATREELELQLTHAKDIDVLRQENEALERRLVERKAEVEDWKRRHGELQESEAEFRRLMEKRDDEVAQFRARLAGLESALEEARERQDAAERELADAGTREELEEKLHRAEQKRAKIEKDHEADLVSLCDLRAKVTRLEEKVDEAQRHERRRVRKILDKIHAALDDAGAPRGDDLSYSERIRRLAARTRGEE